MIRIATVCVASLVASIASGCGSSARHAKEQTSVAASNKRLVRSYYEDVVNTGNVEALDEYISPDFEYVLNGVRHKLGIVGKREHILGVRETYPDLTLTVGRQIAESEWVASVVTARGTHRGVWMNMTPTNKPVTITAVNVDRVVDGRICEHGGAVYLLGPLMEIGAIEVAESVGSQE